MIRHESLLSHFDLKAEFPHAPLSVYPENSFTTEDAEERRELFSLMIVTRRRHGY
jgi:hypothetical protein